IAVAGGFCYSSICGFTVLPGNGDGTLGAPLKFAVGDDTVQGLDVADLNGDGRPDVVVAHNGANGINYTVLLNNAASPFADLAIAKVGAPNPVGIGSNLTYTITIHNNGPGDASSVTVTDTLPASVMLVAASSGCSNVNGTVVCDIGPLAVGGTTNITILVTA